jgi:hypothetical protein
MNLVRDGLLVLEKFKPAFHIDVLQRHRIHDCFHLFLSGMATAQGSD